jgi:hypothetical protein
MASDHSVICALLLLVLIAFLSGRGVLNAHRAASANGGGGANGGGVSVVGGGGGEGE